jgi:hypothetical protein
LGAGVGEFGEGIFSMVSFNYSSDEKYFPKPMKNESAGIKEFRETPTHSFTSMKKSRLLNLGALV